MPTLRGCGIVPVLSVATPWHLAGGNPVDAWEARNAASYAASKVGLFAATVLGEGAGGPLGWAAGAGWSGWAAPNKYLDTTITPDAAQNYALFVQYSGLTVADQYLAGCYDGGGNACAVGYSSGGGGTVAYANGSFVVVAPVPAAAGNLGISGPQGYRNGAADGGLSVAGVWVPGSIYLGGLNTAGSLLLATTATIKRVIVFATPRTPVQAAALAAAMLAAG